MATTAALARLAALCGPAGHAPLRMLHATASVAAASKRSTSKRANTSRRKRVPPPEVPVYTSTDEFRAVYKLDRHTPVSAFAEASGQSLPRALQEQLETLEQTEAAAAEGDPSWGIEVAVSLERYQRLLDAPCEFEKEWIEFRDKIMVEKSALMQTEIDHDKKVAAEARLRAASDGRQRGTDTSLMGDESTFTPAPRETADDINNVRTSLNRKLDQRLFLIMKSAVNGGAWRMPQLSYTSEANLRTVAEACVDEIVGDAEVRFVGNFPVACETSLFETENANGLVGTKTFFFRAALVSLSADIQLPSDKYTEYAWVTRDELPEYNPEFADAAARFMV